MSTCDCFSGTPADGAYNAKGSIELIDGINVYRSLPPSGGPDSNGQHILYLPDGFGLATHNQKLADMYASKGYATTIIDFFEGDALLDCFMKYTPGTDLDAYNNITAEEKDIIRKINMDEWQARHSPSRIASVLDNYLPKYLKDTSGTRHVMGHCFGGKSTFRLAKSTENFSSATVFHPAFLERSDLTDIKVPMFVGLAETDVFSPTLSDDMLSQLPGAGCAYKTVVYGDTVHGFASRPDPEKKTAVQNFQMAFDDSIAWLAMHR